MRKARKVRESAPSNFMVRSSGKPHSDFAGYAKSTLARLQSKRDTGRRVFLHLRLDRMATELLQ